MGTAASAALGAAPAYALVSCLVLFFLYAIYPTYLASVWLVAPILLFATWRLTPRWLAGKFDWRYNGAVVGYTVLAVLVPIVAVQGSRFLTMPERMPRWRAEMLAIDDPAVDAIEQLSNSAWGVPTELAIGLGSSQAIDQARTISDLQALLEQELANDGPVGSYIGYDDIDEYLSFGSPNRFQSTQVVNILRAADADQRLQLQLRGIAVLLKWSHTIREHVAAGRLSGWSLSYADRAESLAIASLRRLTEQQGTTPELARLVDSIPSQDLRRRSRRIGLIGEWRAYQKRPWTVEIDGVSYYHRVFLGTSLAHGLAWNPLERMRADRFIDLATRRTLEQFERGLPSVESEEYRQTKRLWDQAARPQQYSDEHNYTNLGWNNRTDLAIESLRSLYANVPRE